MNLDNYRTYGVEVEFISNEFYQSELVHKLNQALPTYISNAPRIHEASYSNSNSRTWRIKTDSSVRGGRMGLELVTPILRTERDMDILKQILVLLERFHCDVNRSCGLHVHVGVSDWNLRKFKNLVKRWVKFESTFDSIQPRSRRGNTNSYCRSNVDGIASNLFWAFKKINSARDVRELSNIIQSSRYVKLNMHSFWKHGTVEFRHHSGTINPQKIDNWVRVCIAMTHLADNARSIKVKDTDLNDAYANKLSVLFNGLSKGCDLITSDIRRFYTKRRKQLCRG